MTSTTRDLTGPSAEYARILREHMPELRERFGVTYLGLFGSYVRGEQRPDSDLDVLVEFGVTPSLFELVDLRDYISDLVGLEIDLVMKGALKKRIGRQILREVVPI